MPGQDYGVHEGSLASLPSTPDHAPIACSTDSATSHVVLDPGSDRFWLVAPNLAWKEGSLGTGTGGTPRTPLSTCGTVDPEPCP